MYAIDGSTIMEFSKGKWMCILEQIIEKGILYIWTLLTDN